MKTLEKTPTKNLAIFVNPSNALRERTFVVLGVQRGGTSMVAGALRALGVDMGRAGLNHEDRRFLHASEATLSKVIAERNFELPVWGFKAPETTLQLDFLETALRNPHFICVTRNILAVVDSFMMRGAKNPGLAMLRVLKYYNRIGRLVRESKAPLLLVNYERASAKPREFIDAIVSFTEIQASAAIREQAAGMVTGDGGGYLNIPSEYFHVAQSDLQLESFVPQENGIAQVIQTETCALQIQPAYDFLPTRLLLDLNRYSGPSGPGLITFTFKFNGGFSRLHNQSIELKGRSTVFEIETSGTCRGCRIAAAKDWGGGLQGRLLRPPTAKMGG